MDKDAKIGPENLIDFLSALPDPRIDRTKKHELIDILVIAICAAICGAKNWVEIADFGEAKFGWFSKFLNLKHGIPSHDTFRRVFMLIAPNEFMRIFISWTQKVTEGLDLKQLCVDGKTLRRSFQRGKASSAIHMVNVWSTGASLAMGQMKSEDKKNEIKTVPKLLEKLNLKGHIVSSDAMNCQKKTAKKIVDLGGDYLLALKKNNESLLNRVEKKFGESEKGLRAGISKSSCIQENHGHGRIEKRICTVLTKKTEGFLGVNLLKEWESLNSIVEIVSERTIKSTGETTTSKRYYITSLESSAEEILNASRNHWEVENKLHWVLDVVYREDDCTSRTGFLAENFSTLRQLALNLTKLEPSKKSIRRKQKLAGWDEGFLLSIIFQGVNLDA